MGGAQVTELLRSWSCGDPEALDRLMALIYPDLRRIAKARLGREAGGHVLQPTALVNEAVVRLMQLHRMDWQCREQLYALLSTFMRRILVEHARARKGPKRGGGATHVTLHAQHSVTAAPHVDLLDLDNALEKLQRDHPRPARIVELRGFVGMEMDEIASVLAVSRTTVERDWRFACTWLKRALGRGA